MVGPWMCPGWKSLTVLALSCRPGTRGRSALTSVVTMMMITVVVMVIIGAGVVISASITANE